MSLDRLLVLEMAALFTLPALIVAVMFLIHSVV